jgi:predicted HD superfamily hydrolase involved in NAD metabolism
MTYTDELTDKIAEYMEQNLSEKRKVHTYGVRYTAVKLANQYGCDANKAEVAALLHDMYKGLPLDVINYYVKHLGLDKKYLNSPNLAHSKVAAQMIQREFGIQDQDIINAISFHTTGRAGMSLLEKIIYLADAIEPNRNYPELQSIRKLAEEDLDKACLASLNNTIEFVKSRGEFLDNETMEAKKYFEKIISDKENFNDK